MTDIAIRIQGLGKQYRIGPPQRYRTLRDKLTDLAKAPLRGFSKAGDNSFWALSDVSFDVKRGEVIGIVGRNGAGKSTLLKVLSRITDPTQGRVELHGRIGSLLEVGTGFHPELTGRENIFLNGAILGMRRAEIAAKFDEMVAFAEVERFLDTPVKHYSSGMYTRLAFAVAAHLDPEILIVDEVLAVGDAKFQEKCLDKMGKIARGGRTVVFVSHNMTALRNLCQRAVLLEAGQVRDVGPVQHVVDRYLHDNLSSSGEVRLAQRAVGPDDKLRFSALRIKDHQGRASPLVDMLKGCTVEIDYQVFQPLRAGQVSFELLDPVGGCVLCSSDFDVDTSVMDQLKAPGHYRVSCFVPPDFLRAGRYTINLGASVPGVLALDEVPAAISFDVQDSGSMMFKLGQGRRGVVAPVLRWATEYAAA